MLYCKITAEREAVNAAERAERKVQLRDKVSITLIGLTYCLSSLIN